MSFAEVSVILGKGIGMALCQDLLTMEKKRPVFLNFNSCKD